MILRCIILKLNNTDLILKMEANNDNHLMTKIRMYEMTNDEKILVDSSTMMASFKLLLI